MQNDTLDKFDSYPVYGPKVTALIELLASIASRMNNDQPEIQTNKVGSYGNK